MSLPELRVFVAIAELGSARAAAEALAITPSAVSMRLAHLEERLGAQLFDRSRRPAVATREGEAILGRAREILRLYDDLPALVGHVLRGSLRLGVVPSASAEVLPQTLARLREAAPELEIRVVSGLSADLVEAVRARSLDAALVTATGPAPTGLAQRIVSREPFLIIGAREAALEAPGSLEVALAERPFLAFNRRTGVGQIIDRALRRQGLEISPVMELDSLDAICRMTALGLGVAIVPAGSIPRRLLPELLTEPFGDPPLERALALVAPDLRAGPVARLAESLGSVSRPPDPEGGHGPRPLGAGTTV